MEHEGGHEFSKNQAEIADCKIERYGTTIYLMPDIDNKYLGFTKADLKKNYVKPNATDRDYYLAQFVILTLLLQNSMTGRKHQQIQRIPETRRAAEYRQSG